jgi:hypothetical protein
VSAKSGGKPPRRAVPKTSTASGAPKPRVPRSESASAARRVRSAETWSKRSAGKWVAGQSYGLTPGSEQGVARRRNNPKYVARTKKVIRPRILKRPKPQSPA